jgi:oxygen-independent coproporphyrinogen-3 oxidase
MRPLAVYIHWPFCLSKCPYCDFNSHVREKVEQERWRAALLTELRYMAQHTQGHRVRSIFFGGGTPSLMPPSTVAALIEAVQALWPCANDIEITLEANPTSVEVDKFRQLREAGVDRLSLGVQSLRQSELSFLGRGHSVEEALRAIGYAREVFERYSFDLIYARPNQTLADWEEELAQGLALSGGHLSLYQLTIEENTAFYHAYAKGAFAMPDEEHSAALYALTESMTSAHGLHGYEVSNYAASGQESRHNLAYWQGNAYVGIGPGAHGRIPLEHGSGLALPAGSSVGARTATQAIKSPERWLEQVERSGHGYEPWQAIDTATEVQERVMMGLRLKDGIDYAAMQARTGFDLRPFLNEKKIRFYQDKGLLVASNERLAATEAGRLVLTQLTGELL